MPQLLPALVIGVALPDIVFYLRDKEGAVRQAVYARLRPFLF